MNITNDQPVCVNNILKVIPLFFSTSEPSSWRTFTSFNSGARRSACAESSKESRPCSTSCKQATPVIIFVHDAIQKTFSGVRGSEDPCPRFPPAWENSRFPSFPTAATETPGSPFVVSLQAESIRFLSVLMLAGFNWLIFCVFSCSNLQAI